MKKIFIKVCGVIAGISIISNAVYAGSYSFTDLEGHWAKEYIDDMVSEGYIDGYPDNTFRPDNYITKAEAGKILVEVFDLPKIELDYDLFNDVSGGDWYESYAYAAEMLLDDIPDADFNGGSYVTRISAALAIARIWGIDYSTDSGSSKNYADYKADLSTDTVRDKNGLISTMTDLEIMNGKDNGFAPDEYLTRAELCTLLMRTINDYGTPSLSYLNSFKKIIEALTNGYYDAQTTLPSLSEDESVSGSVSEPTPEQTATPTDVSEPDWNAYKRRVVELVNEERAKEGKHELTEDDLLDKTAQQHSDDMAKNDFFDHTNLKGETPFDRMDNNGVEYMAAAENIALGQMTPEEVMDSWMNSDGHRRNILSDNYNKIGIGIAQDEYGTIYWTQNFTD